MVLATIFSLELKDEANTQKFLQNFAVLQQHCHHNEPGTITYELHQVVHEGRPVPHKFLVLERYCRVEDFEETHAHSAPFLKFFQQLGDLDILSQSLVTGVSTAAQEELNQYPAQWSADAITNPLLQKGVLVFGGARHGKKEAYTTEAKALATCIAAQGKPLVYGGGTVGVMGELAQEAVRVGGKVIAVIPAALCPREASGDMIGDLVYYAATMSERKSIMFAHASVVVALPGGVGTFDELLEVITLFQLNAYRPKIGVVNVEGFFDPFLAMLRHLIDEGFLEEKVFEFVVVRPTAAELMTALESFVPPESPAATLKWHTRP